jgi:hypothetical protein
VTTPSPTSGAGLGPVVRTPPDRQRPNNGSYIVVEVERTQGEEERCNDARGRFCIIARMIPVPRTRERE